MGFFDKLKSVFSKKEKDEKTYEVYDSGLKESRKAFTHRLNKLNKKYRKVNEEYFEEIEEILISSDCGVSFTLKVMEDLLERVKKEKVEDSDKINEILFEILFSSYLDEEEKEEKNVGLKFESHPEVILISGVNGVGKTTSIAKLAHFYIKEGKKVLLIAADTFRAGAKEQLTYWAEKINAEIISGNDNEDPASVVYKGLEYAKKHNFDLIIIDTAGRLQNKVNLMNELKKISKVIEKEDYKLDECLLVLDATTGQNGVLQAKAFKEILPLTGIILTKMDGTSKGGIIFSIKNELDLSVRFIGLGEKMDDLRIFDLSEYINGLLKDDEIVEEEENHQE